MTTENGPELLVGETPDHDDVAWNLSTTPHLLVHGPTGSGTSTALRAVLHGAGLRHVDTVVCASGGHPGLWDTGQWPGVQAVSEATDHHELLLRNVADEVSVRTRTLRADPTANLRHLIVAIDSWPTLIRTARIDDRYIAATLMSLVSDLLAGGRGVNVHVALAGHTTDPDIVPTSWLPQLRGLLLLGRVLPADRAKLGTRRSQQTRTQNPGDGWSNLPNLDGSEVLVFDPGARDGDAFAPDFHSELLQRSNRAHHNHAFAGMSAPHR